jgi:magnesium transporter
MSDKRRLDRLDQPAIEFAHRDFVCVEAQRTVADAIACSQHTRVDSKIIYFYAVDADGRLMGVVPTRQLLLSPPDTPISNLLLRNLITLPADATLLDACELFVLHRLLALPIVDDEGRILGIVDVEQYADEIHDMDVREQVNDVFQLIGVRLGQVKGNSVVSHYGNRFPWLLCNIGGGLACAVVAGLFEVTLAKVLALALFIPVVLALAESVSIQSLTLTLQSQHGGRLGWGRVGRLALRELPLGLLLGASCGMLVGLTAWLWQGDAHVALCLLVSITLSVAAAAMFGLLVPSVLMIVQRDPQVASGPITLASADITTTLIYLGLATWWLL